MMDSETHRQFYLAAAGIRMWYAKRPLPGAAPSPDYQFTADETSGPDALYSEPKAMPTPVVKAKTARTAPPAPLRPRSVDLQSLMTPKPEPAESRIEEVAEAKESQPAIEPAPSEARPPIHANLALWATGAFVLVSQWSDEASERLQDTLARNLLSALGQSDAGERSVLRWPVFRNPNIPGNSPEDFQQVLSRCLASCPDRSIILLGVLSAEQPGQREHCLQAALPRVGVDFAHSLAEIAATPAHKRDLWNALKSRYSL